MTFKEYYQKNRQKIINRQRLYRRKCKSEIIAAYGGKCSCCGESTLEFLTIEYTNKDGAKHLREIGGTNRMHSWLKRNNYPKDGYSVLCFNCNAADFYYGRCPHKLLNGSEKE